MASECNERGHPVTIFLDCHALRARNDNYRLNEKNTMQLVTIEMPDSAVLRKSAQAIVFPLNSEVEKTTSLHNRQ